MRFSVALLALVVGHSAAFQPQPLQQRKSSVIRASVGGAIEEFSRWDQVGNRVSLNNSGPGAPVGRYDLAFTPLPPRARDYEYTEAYYASSTEPIESRWDTIEKMTSLRNSGPGAPRARYDISFTPMPNVARDYERTAAIFEAEGMKESRWDDIENRRSLANSGAGAPRGQYDISFTPLPPRARDYEIKVAQYDTSSIDGVKESRWDDISTRRSLGNTGAGAPAGNYDITFTPAAPRAREHGRSAAYESGPVQSRWDLVENRVSMGNSGPGPLPGQYDVTFTPLPPRGRDYDDMAAYHVPANDSVESRWDLVEKRTSLSNSGPGAPPGEYGVAFTPMPPRARDYGHKTAYYGSDEGPIESRWDLVEKRTSLVNSGPGALPGTYEVTFTPLPPVARESERTISYDFDRTPPPTTTSEPEENISMPMPSMSMAVMETAQV